MTPEDIQALTDEELMNRALSVQEFGNTPLNHPYYMMLFDEALRRSNLDADRRAARGERPLFPETCPRIRQSGPNETNTDGPKG